MGGSQSEPVQPREEEMDDKELSPHISVRKLLQGILTNGWVSAAIDSNCMICDVKEYSGSGLGLRFYNDRTMTVVPTEDPPRAQVVLNTVFPSHDVWIIFGNKMDNSFETFFNCSNRNFVEVRSFIKENIHNGLSMTIVTSKINKHDSESIKNTENRVDKERKDTRADSMCFTLVRLNGRPVELGWAHSILSLKEDSPVILGVPILIRNTVHRDVQELLILNDENPEWIKSSSPYIVRGKSLVTSSSLEIDV